MINIIYKEGDWHVIALRDDIPYRKVFFTSSSAAKNFTIFWNNNPNHNWQSNAIREQRNVSSVEMLKDEDENINF